MSREKQIEKMAKEFSGECKESECEKCLFLRYCKAHRLATNIYNADYRKQSEVAREIIDDILEALQGEIDTEDKLGRIAWDESDTVSYHIHQYAEEKLDTLKIALSLYKNKYKEAQK